MEFSGMWHLLPPLPYSVFAFLSYSSLMHVSFNMFLVLQELINLNTRLTFASFTEQQKCLSRQELHKHHDCVSQLFS